MKPLIFCVIFSISVGIIGCEPKKDDLSNTKSPIQPWSENPFYWEYHGNPVLLLGGTINDNLFQNNNLNSHLDSLAEIGGNYVRNTMSDRDEGDLKAFAKTPEGKYDLDQWNETYWGRFENLLKWAQDREIIVQVEIWDRFDHSREEWNLDPFNPKNNVNYSYTESRLDSLYPNSAVRNEQPFFYTVPAVEDNKVLLSYQEAFVKKILSISLQYDNVLYCIDNETKGVDEWAVYWADFIHHNAGEKQVYLTQMWDDWDIKSDMHKRTLDHPERYQYVDMSQNSHITGQLNWDNAQYIFDYIKNKPRPVNSTKIYGSQTSPWINRGIDEEHAIQTFFRNVLGGFASSRFHRPPAGLGLSTPSINSIKTVRKLEEKVKLWEFQPRMDLLLEAEEDEAYLSAEEGYKYLVFFPAEGDVKVDLSPHQGKFELVWISVLDAEWNTPIEIQGGDHLSLQPPVSTGSLAVILKK